MKDPTSPVCRTISTLLSRIGDKWTVLVVQTLGDGSKRFNELRREIPSVSQRMLALTLRNLERDGLVSRTVTPPIPPRVDYELTALGQSLQKPICGLAPGPPKTSKRSTPLRRGLTPRGMTRRRPSFAAQSGVISSGDGGHALALVTRGTGDFKAR